MILDSFSYTGSSWSFQGAKGLKDFNLFVGKNAAGKTRTLRAIYNVVMFLRQIVIPEHANLDVSLGFIDGNNKLLYEFNVKDGDIQSEKMTLIASAKEKILILRNHEKATIYDDYINPPKNRLIVHVRRDIKLYPEIEHVMNWAENSTYMQFNMLETWPETAIPFESHKSKVNSLYTMVSSMSDEAKKNVVLAAQSIDYQIDMISTIELESGKYFVVVENGVPHPLLHDDLSNGMYRTLFLLVFLEYISGKSETTLILIDDFCEGLDYDRSAKLSKMVLQFCKTHNIQIIVSSNDRFMMNTVPLGSWNILFRNGNNVSCLNETTHPDLFEHFSFTGLSNFDLFSTDFIERHLDRPI